MSLIDALETENKQALGTLEAVVAQRDRLRTYTHGLEQFIWHLCRDQALYERVIAHRREVAEITKSDLSESETAVRAQRRREQG